jgi:hypothetical protein
MNVDESKLTSNNAYVKKYLIILYGDRVERIQIKGSLYEKGILDGWRVCKFDEHKEFKWLDKKQDFDYDVKVNIVIECEKIIDSKMIDQVKY